MFGSVTRRLDGEVETGVKQLVVALGAAVFMSAALFVAYKVISFWADYMGQLAHDLVPILPELEGPKFDIYLVYPEELRHSQRIVVFRDFLLRSITAPQK